MEDSLSKFREQFEWFPIVDNATKLGSHHNFIVAGLGGSHLAADLIKKFAGDREIIVHQDYGLPWISEARLRNTLFIASSHSGNTEETLDAAKAAFEKGMHVAAISTGGALLEFAREHELPFVTIPDTGLEPRMAIGYSLLGIAKLMGDPAVESAVREGGKRADYRRQQMQGVALAEKLRDKIPMVWASNANSALAFIWKIKFNETAKIPAFSNFLPELSHNEFTGFDVVDATRELSSKIHVLMLRDAKDDPRIQKRMQISEEMLHARGIAVDRIELEGQDFEKIFSSTLLSDWVVLGLAQYYGVPILETPLIAEFKKRMAQ